jgi:hypothetical protein
MIVRGWFKTEDHVTKTVLYFDRLGLSHEFGEALYRVVKDQSSEKCFTVRGAEESIVPVLGDIDAYDQIFIRSANGLLKRSKLF